MLMKANSPQAADAYAKAVRLDPAKSGILPVSWGQALMAIGTPEALKKAMAQIRNGLDRDHENSEGFRYLAQPMENLVNSGSRTCHRRESLLLRRLPGC